MRRDLQLLNLGSKTIVARFMIDASRPATAQARL